MKQFETYWVELPTSGGREQSGRRPAVVVQDEQLTANLPTVLIVPLTSQSAAERFAGTFVIEPDDDNGLRMASVALVFQLRALDKRFLGERIGRLGTDDARRLSRMVHVQFGEGSYLDEDDSLREALHRLVDELPPEDILPVIRILRGFIMLELSGEPYPDEVGSWDEYARYLTDQSRRTREELRGRLSPVTRNDDERSE